MRLPSQGDLAAELFGLEIVVPDIHSIKNNYTRFLLLRPAGQPLPSGADKASLCFKTDHEHGSLMRVLRAIENSTINMTKLQSSPIPKRTLALHVPYRYGVRQYGGVRPGVGRYGA